MAITYLYNVNYYEEKKEVAEMVCQLTGKDSSFELDHMSFLVFGCDIIIEPKSPSVGGTSL